MCSRAKEEWLQYFQRLDGIHPELDQSMKKPCINSKGLTDCAVTTKYYLSEAEGLKIIKDLDPELYQRTINNWFCHNDSSKICKGLLNYLEFAN